MDVAAAFVYGIFSKALLSRVEIEVVNVVLDIDTFSNSIYSEITTLSGKD